MWFHLETAAPKNTEVRREGKHLPLVMSTVLIARGVGWSTAGAFHIPQGPNEQLHPKTQQKLVWDGAWLPRKGMRRRRRRFPRCACQCQLWWDRLEQLEHSLFFHWAKLDVMLN